MFVAGIAAVAGWATLSPTAKAKLKTAAVPKRTLMTSRTRRHVFLFMGLILAVVGIVLRECATVGTTQP
jgi:hypothetical protein